MPSTRDRRRSRPGLGAALAIVVVGGLVAVSVACSPDTPDAADRTATSAASALPPCPLSALDAATDPVEIVVWHSMVAKQKETLEALIGDYNATHPKVRVRAENVAATDEELLRRFQSSLPNRDLPALFVANDTMTQQMIDSGVVLPAQSCVDASGYDLSPFAETVKAYYTIDDVLWAGSANPGSALVFINKDHYRRAGLDPESPPKTLAELRAHAEAIKAAGIADRPFVHEVASYKTEFWLTGAHAPIVDNDNGRAAPARAAALEGNPDTQALFEWFARMQADGLLNAIPVAEGQINQYLAMATQQASIIVETSSASTSVEAFLSGELDAADVAGGSQLDGSQASGLDIGAGAFPGLHEPGRTQMGGPAWYVMSTRPPAEQAASWDFLTFMNSEPAQLRMLTGASFLPYRTSVSQTPEAQQFFGRSLAGRALRIADEQVRTIDPAFPGPLIGPYDATRDTLRDALTAVTLEQVPPASAIADAQRDITRQLTSYAEGGF